ncbi:unnamed protein product [Linum tenue]|nr:unnamed protein product [Linum tenue]
MDTGSSLTWVKCLPCSPCTPGGGAATALFDPAKSKSYYALPCTDDNDFFNDPCSLSLT